MSIDEIDVFWVLLCACLVWIMQAGFLCLETGLTRSKNNINVALKNICDNATSIFLFWLVGFSIAFGVPFSNPLSAEQNFYLFQSSDNRLNAFFVFQAVFCSTCCTIVSGAAAERLRFVMYPVLVALIAGLIYPVAANLVWGGTIIDNELGLLAGLGFYDFAGATVVHATGGWVALALVIVVGPRLGRFNARGQPQTIQGSNLTLSSLGVLVLWFGWLGFNGGSAYNFESDIGIILSNTLISGASSLVTTLILVSRRDRTPAPEDLINGALGGLVGITASANCVTSVAAFLIGAGSAVAVLLCSRLLLRLRLDDVVGAVPVHLAAGTWGALAVGLFGDLQLVGTGLGRAEQIGVQLFGSCVVGAWAFGMSLLLILLINRRYPFRVSRNDETVGLNISEHGATTELYELLAFMRQQSETGSLTRPAPSDLITESGVIGMAYNHVMDKLRSNEQQLRHLNDELRSYDQIVAHDLKNPLAVIRSYAELMEDEELGGQEHRRYVERIRSSSEHALAIIRELLSYARSGGELAEPATVELEPLLYGLLDEQAADVERTGARVTLELGLPEVWFDRFALQQILANLLDNALKYADPARSPRILISSMRRDGLDLITVRDNGLGMNAEQLSRAFDNHTRLHRVAEGHGLGLPHARKLARAGGASLQAESIVGQGSLFTLAVLPKPDRQGGGSDETSTDT